MTMPRILKVGTHAEGTNRQNGFRVGIERVQVWFQLPQGIYFQIHLPNLGILDQLVKIGFGEVGADEFFILAFHGS